VCYEKPVLFLDRDVQPVRKISGGRD